VLHPPSREQAEAIEASIDRALQVVPLLVDAQFDRAMMKLHAAPKTPAP
jgi:peptidyl-tRNA hydrolase (EC 3.1.1.29)